ncbi:MAG: histidine kinase [Saprospiraceae bacterium]
MKDVNLIITILSALIFMMGISLLVIWFFSKGQKKIMKARMLQKEQELNFQKELLDNTIRIQEEERNRIASELHDDITSQLNIIHLNLHVLKKDLGGPNHNNPVLEQIESSLASSIDRSRKMAHELMPPLLQKFGITYVLQELENSVNQSMALQMQVSSSHLIGFETVHDQLHLYRIIQELINNTLKYANAKNIKISFKNEGDQLCMNYSDDGRGFVPSEIKPGSGLKNIQSRCQLLKGSFEINPMHEKSGFHAKFLFSKNGNN